MAAAQWNAGQDPLDGLVGRSRRERGWSATSVGAAAATHALIALALGTLVSRRLPAVQHEQVTQVIDIDLPKLPLPAPEPPVPPPPPTPNEAHAATRTPAPAAPAHAAAVLTKAPDPNEAVDLSDGFVAGSSATYAGGTTSANGTSARAVQSAAREMGTSEEHGTRPAPVGPDRSRKAVLSGGQPWNCGFPGEADRDQIDEAVVGIRVVVDVSGAPKTVTITRDPGHGFAREAERCAMSKRWTPALDREGTPQEGTVTVNVRFER